MQLALHAGSEESVSAVAVVARPLGGCIDGRENGAGTKAGGVQGASGPGVRGIGILPGVGERSAAAMTKTTGKGWSVAQLIDHSDKGGHHSTIDGVKVITVAFGRVWWPPFQRWPRWVSSGPSCVPE